VVAAERLGVAPHEALYVGDRRDVDVAGAHAAGMHAAWIGTSAARSAAAENTADAGPDGLAFLTAGDLSELVDAILVARA